VLSFKKHATAHRIHACSQKYSTTRALISFTEFLRQSTDSNEFGCGIFIGFDIVNHTILLPKLNYYDRNKSMGNLEPRVLRFLGQRWVAGENSGDTKKFNFFDWLSEKQS